ncbi:transmembrane and ubiquitin-like domain-containing protein 1 isoform 2-T2 [Anomaloglossus baeobatrachus]|uniref:transmembrane and ubiquitin-like domain-containing protein 1 isoform X2 n=1 Tax=Anomaloglossus baeobatrachus TaxID=238106 RepID=UPI003F50C396
MALIEGVGDEVTVLCAFLLLISLIALAWISTHTSERGSASWWSQASAELGTEPQSRPFVTDTNRAPGSGEPEGPTPSPAEDDVGSSANSDALSSEQGPSIPCDSPTVRHRGPLTQGISAGTQGISAGTQGISAGTQGTITLRLKFLNETERVVSVQPTDSVLHIKRSQFPGQEPRVRLIYQGQLLRDDSQTVASLQLADGCVLHCHLSQHAAAFSPGGDELSQDSVNIGSLMVPLFLLLLGILCISNAFQRLEPSPSSGKKEIMQLSNSQML